MSNKDQSDLIVAAIMQGGPWDKRHESACRVYDPNGISPTLTAGGGGGVETKVIIWEDGTVSFGEDADI